MTFACISDRQNLGTRQKFDTISLIQCRATQCAWSGWISVPGKDGLSYMAQQTKRRQTDSYCGRIIFPKLGLSCIGTGNRNDIAGLNKGESFACHRKDGTQGDIAEWGLFLKHSGEIQLQGLVQKSKCN